MKSTRFKLYHELLLSCYLIHFSLPLKYFGPDVLKEQRVRFNQGSIFLCTGSNMDLFHHGRASPVTRQFLPLYICISTM
jgi:hypothetical protein